MNTKYLISAPLLENSLAEVSIWADQGSERTRGSGTFKLCCYSAGCWFCNIATLPLGAWISTIAPRKYDTSPDTTRLKYPHPSRCGRLFV
jgi:hypothetical protein